jgi:hypothetical protein
MSTMSHQGPSLIEDDLDRPSASTAHQRMLFQNGKPCDMLVLVLQVTSRDCPPCTSLRPATYAVMERSARKAPAWPGRVGTHTPLHSHAAHAEPTRMDTHGYGVVPVQGKVTVSAGQEEFTSTMGPWSVLGERSLTSESAFVPDFNAEVHGAGRLLLIHHVTYLNHLRIIQVRTAPYQRIEIRLGR